MGLNDKMHWEREFMGSPLIYEKECKKSRIEKHCNNGYYPADSVIIAQQPFDV
ncbi:MAG: hypothetical protein ACLQQ4_05035 [Bacteroidia bacterium]